MNREETRNILTILRVNYPTSFTNVSNEKDMNLIVNTWGILFKNDNVSDVYNAILKIIASNTSGFAPTIGQIKDVMNQPFKNCVMSDEKAWSIVLNNAKVDFNQAKRNFERLPETLKKPLKILIFFQSLETLASFNKINLNKCLLKDIEM